MQLRWLVVIAFAWPGAAHAQDERRASGGIGVYADDDQMTVVSPSAGAEVPVTDAVRVDVNATADIISGASVDVVSEASPTAIRETRVELGVGSTWRATRVLSMRVRGIGSYESDYQSVRASVGGVYEFAARNASLDVEYMVGADEAGSAVDATFSESRTIHRGIVTLTHVLDPRTYADLAIDGQRGAGFHASAYRTVPIADPSTPDILRVAEATPRVRTGVAMRAGVRRALTKRWFAHADYRFYADDWSVQSHTASATAIASRGRLQLGARLRGYVQSAADFYAPHYELDATGAPPALRTRERRLSRMRSGYAGLTADWQHDDAHFVLAIAGMRLLWPDFPAQSARNATMITASIDTSF